MEILGKNPISYFDVLMPSKIDAKMFSMRTTLTLDDEVSDGLRRLQKRHPEKSFKQIVNDVMHSGLAVNGQLVRKPFKLRKHLNAKPRPGLDFSNMNRLISQVEGDFHK